MKQEQKVEDLQAKVLEAKRLIRMAHRGQTPKEFERAMRLLNEVIEVT